MKVLIIVTLQNDFCSFGNVAVEAADFLVEKANLLMPFFDKLVAVNFAFPPNHLSFAANHIFRQPGKSMLIQGREQLLKPMHCVDGSFGAEFPSGLQYSKINLIQYVGTQSDKDVYSIYRDVDSDPNLLFSYLMNLEKLELYFMGVISSFFLESLKESIKNGFEVFVIRDACVGTADLSAFKNVHISEIV